MTTNCAKGIYLILINFMSVALWVAATVGCPWVVAKWVAVCVAAKWGLRFGLGLTWAVVRISPYEKFKYN